MYSEVCVPVFQTTFLGQMCEDRPKILKQSASSLQRCFLKIFAYKQFAKVDIKKSKSQRIVFIAPGRSKRKFLEQIIQRIFSLSVDRAFHRKP